jgi:ABC-type antimicrobial peptide transport system permease subunit
LKNPLFVEKILSAINTNIEHKEVTILRVAFTAALVILMALAVCSHLEVTAQFDTIQGYMVNNQLWVQDQFFLSNLMHLSYNITASKNKSADMANNAQYALNYKITFDPPTNVNFLDNSGLNHTVRLNEAMTMIQGNLVNVFKNSSISQRTDIMIRNYYESVYPVLTDYSPAFGASVLPMMLFLGAVLLLGSVVAGVWIYNAMRIDVKCFDIILWFLDIPVAYVGYLQANCNTYIKSYTSVKELIEKGINFHDRNLYLEDYQGAA